MIMEDKKFPVPGTEAEKLDEVVHTLEQQPFSAKLDDQIRSRPWPFLLGAFALGLLCSVACGRR
jgi:hypothetical protein